MKLTHEVHGLLFLRFGFTLLLGLVAGVIVSTLYSSDLITISSIAIINAIFIFKEYDTKLAKAYQRLWNLKD